MAIADTVRWAHDRVMTVHRLPGMAGDGGTAIVLGGGGNLGATQVGMLRALLERGVEPAILVGCSVGALNAAGLAADPTLAGVERRRCDGVRHGRRRVVVEPCERSPVHAVGLRPRAQQPAEPVTGQQRR